MRSFLPRSAALKIRQALSAVMLVGASMLGVQSGAAAQVNGTCSPARPHTSAITKYTMSGTGRSYSVRVPVGYSGRTALPVLFVFHGATVDAYWQALYDQLGKKGSERGYVVVYGEGLDAKNGKSNWNFLDRGGPSANKLFAAPAPDDVAYADALVSELKTRLCIDPERMYIAGHSAGSAFSGYLACQSQHTFAAAAMVSATPEPSTCASTRRLSTIHFHGTADTTVDYEGIEPVRGTCELSNDGSSCVPSPDIESAVHGWAAHNGCFGSPATSLDVSYRGAALRGVDRIAYSCGIAGYSDVLYRIRGGKHGWPGSSASFASWLGFDTGTPGVPASDIILDFFDTF